MPSSSALGVISGCKPLLLLLLLLLSYSGGGVASLRRADADARMERGEASADGLGDWEAWGRRLLKKDDRSWVGDGADAADLLLLSEPRSLLLFGGGFEKNGGRKPGRCGGVWGCRLLFGAGDRWGDFSVEAGSPAMLARILLNMFSVMDQCLSAKTN